MKNHQSDRFLNMSVRESLTVAPVGTLLSILPLCPLIGAFSICKRVPINTSKERIPRGDQPALISGTMQSVRIDAGWMLQQKT